MREIEKAVGGAHSNNREDSQPPFLGLHVISNLSRPFNPTAEITSSH